MLSSHDTFNLLLIGLSQGCAYALVALGFVLIYKATEIVNFAHGEFMMLGAFFALSFTQALGFWPGVLCAVLAMGACSYLLDATLMRRIVGQSQASIFILTVALGFILRALAGMAWGWETKPLPSPFTGTVDLGGLAVGKDRLAIIAVTVASCVLLYLFFARSRLGLAMQAIGQNQLAAYYMSIPVKRLISCVWALGAMVAAVAGVFNAPFTQVDTLIGFVGLKALAGAIIGGFGSIPGAVLGCLLIGGIEPFADYYLPMFKGVSAFVMMLLVLFVKPEGLIAQTFSKKV